MWKAAVGHNVSVKVESQGDDWDTDPDFVNDISEKEQRWGAKTIEGSGRAEHIDIHQLRSKVSEEHEVLKKKELETAPKASYGYGGKFGTEKDRMDKSALGHEYIAEVGMHSSQTDAAKGFGGRYGVQKDRADKSALGFDYKGEVEKHASQKDYAVGFGGKFGVQKERQDKSALGWTHKEEVKPHESQTDYAKGFGGRYGVQKDRVDKSATGFDDMEAPTSSYEKTKPVEAASSGAGGLRQRFENMAKSAEEDNRRRAEEERGRRQARDQRERQAAREQQKEKDEKQPKETRQNEDTAKEDSACKLPLAPVVVHPEARLPSALPVHQGGAEEEDEPPPVLPPRSLDLDEIPRGLPAPPPAHQPLYVEATDDGGDYEDVAEPFGRPVPPPFQEEDEEDGGAEYEEMPPHFGHSETIDNDDDDEADGGQDYEEIPDRAPGSYGAGPASSGSEGPLYEVSGGTLSAVALYDYQGGKLVVSVWRKVWTRSEGSHSSETPWG
nr:hematopoietic lineage cell-specific protein-like isoform X3 [Pogona vitticeps]